MRIDLHLHSTASDGSLDPGDLVRAARDGGLDVIALTDHDTVDGVAAALVEARAEPDRGPTVIPGIEISSTLGDVELHILGYGIDPEHPGLRDFGRIAANRRLDRMEGMIERLAKFGIHVTLDDVLQEADKASTVGRPHLARALVRNGAVDSVAEAFQRYLADDRPAFLPTKAIAASDAVRLIHDAGGLAVWAHPPIPVFTPTLPKLVDLGLEGVECFRPRNASHETRILQKEAERFGLVTTGGSDWHGHWQGPLGSFFVARNQVEEFLGRM